MYFSFSSSIQTVLSYRTKLGLQQDRSECATIIRLSTMITKRSQGLQQGRSEGIVQTIMTNYIILVLKIIRKERVLIFLNARLRYSQQPLTASWCRMSFITSFFFFLELPCHHRNLFLGIPRQRPRSIFRIETASSDIRTKAVSRAVRGYILPRKILNEIQSL